MDRALNAAPWAPAVARQAAADALILPSRAQILESLAAGLEPPTGPWLLTGEPGAGKTWLVERLRAGDRSSHWVSVDVSGSTTPAGLLSSLAFELGLDPAGPGAIEATRQALTGFWADEAQDGRRWILVVDEVHLAGVEVLEELRLLSNRLGRRDGLAGLILVGQTGLTRRLMGHRALRPLAARLAGHLHLPAIDADEAGLLLAAIEPARARALSASGLEALHRDAGGNPGHLVRALRLRPQPSPVPAPSPNPSPAPSLARPAPAAAPAPIETPAAPKPAARSPRADWREPGPVEARPAAAPLLPARPPLHVSEGLIEVGWEADLEAEPVGALATDGEDDAGPGHDDEHDELIESLESLVPTSTPLDRLVVDALDESDAAEAAYDREHDLQSALEHSHRDEPAAGARLGVEEPIDDHYATLQAWSEWATRQGRSPALASPAAHDASAPADDQPDSALRQRRNLWADAEQEFAPYSQLFARARAARKNTDD